MWEIVGDSGRWWEMVGDVGRCWWMNMVQWVCGVSMVDGREKW